MPSLYQCPSLVCELHGLFSEPHHPMINCLRDVFIWMPLNMSALTRQILKSRSPLPNRSSQRFSHLSKCQVHHLMVQAKNLGVTLHSSLFIISHIFSISNLPFKIFLDSGHYPTLGPATLIQATSAPQPGNCNELPTDAPPHPLSLPYVLFLTQQP